MSTEAIGAAAPEATIVTDVIEQQPANARGSKPTGLHSPPDSNNAMNLDGSDSELSDLDEVADKLAGRLDGAGAPVPAPAVEAEADPEPKDKIEEEPEDIGEVLPDHWSGTVPVFRPTMKQFRDFKIFMGKVDKYGMKSGIIKIIPPQEWKDSLPPYDDLIKQVRVREPIKQEIMGSNGTYRQVNILHQRSYNLPQWRQLCEQSEHQPPARRGERRANAEKHKPVRSTRAAAPSSASKSSAPAKKKRGRPARASMRAAKEETAEPEERPMTPVSPPPETEEKEKEEVKQEVVQSVEQDPGENEPDECEEDDVPVVRRMGGFSRQSKPKTQSVSARRKYVRREGSVRIDEEAFKDFDYQMDVSDFTAERCEELERIYWKTLTYAPPLYGADLLGTLFHESTELWNLNKLPNLLDVLGAKVPGVNTAYLYLGMWKATFAWHLEDVDLYSINYLHFGAPKQWYSISQADARRFEAAMKNIWPTDARACDQFLRHKGFLISPTHLKQQYNITVNKCVSYPGEFVVTYPYGYHSGYNLGYNCAEAVNFALDSWLPMGKIAKKCQCAQAQDSVWVDVYEIERKLRGEETEYEITEDEEEEEDDDDDDNETGLPSPPSSHTVRIKAPGKKRKRALGDDGKVRVKKVRVRPKSHVEPPCCLCPHDIPGAEIMPTDDGRKAHRMCALYLPETYIETVDDQEIIANVGGIDKARLDLKCLYCHSKKGACFQCSQKKCPRAYHATCAAAAGVFVEDAEVPVIGEDGTEYKEQAFEFSCRFHRTKRDRKLDGETLENDSRIREAAAALKKHDICQLQYFRGDIFAGVVLENRPEEETLLIQAIPGGYGLEASRKWHELTFCRDQIEVEWKWLLLPDPADFRLPKASANAIPMPTSRKAQRELNAKRPVDDVPRKDDEFGPGFFWAEFNAGDAVNNKEQVKLDLSKDNQVWHYIGLGSTDTKAQYTEDVGKQQHNLKSNFLDTIPKPPKLVPMAPPQPKRSYSATHPALGTYQKITPVPLPPTVAAMQNKPYMYKPRTSLESAYPQFATQQFAPRMLPASSDPMLPQMQSRPQPPMQPRPFAAQTPSYHQSQPLPPLQQPHPLQQQTPLQPRPRPQVPPQQPPHHQQQRQQPQPQHRQGLGLGQHGTSFEQNRTPGQEPQSKKPTAPYFYSDRFAPVGGSNGFPSLPGLTWPPAHMTSGHHSQPPSRVWSADSPTDAAAASGLSVLKTPVSGHTQTGVAGAQPLASGLEKYKFFQAFHNGSQSAYRTPYGRRGGFTNGYEGQEDPRFRSFMAKAQAALKGKKPAIKPIPPSLLQPLQPRPSPSPGLGIGGSPDPGYGSPFSRILPRPEPSSPHSSNFLFPFDGRGLSPSTVLPFHSSTPGPTTSRACSIESRDSASASLYPAMRPQHGGSRSGTPGQLSDGGWPRQSPAPTSGGGPARSSSQQPGASKAPAFTKQSHSPIPLPPYVKQAMAASSSGPQKPSPLSQPPQQQASPQQPFQQSRPEHASAGPVIKSEFPPPAPAGYPPNPPNPANTPTYPTANYTPSHHNTQAAPQYAAPEYYQASQQFQWAPQYEPQRQQAAPEATPSTLPASVAPQDTWYQDGMGYPGMQEGGVPHGYTPGPAPMHEPAASYAPPAQDQTGIVERMMMNLKRAAQMGNSS
ncbi:hypothetical protein OQA88_12713 [Cercophora sp. LCS_1]